MDIQKFIRDLDEIMLAGNIDARLIKLYAAIVQLAYKASELESAIESLDKRTPIM